MVMSRGLLRPHPDFGSIAKHHKLDPAVRIILSRNAAILLFASSAKVG